MINLKFTHQHFIISSYTCLGHPGGGGSLYPFSTFSKACNRQHGWQSLWLHIDMNSQQQQSICIFHCLKTDKVVYI